MSFNLPPHLQTLNSIPTNSPPSGINDEQEEAFWGYMHTDDLFANFGFVPSPNEHLKDETPAAAVTQTQQEVVSSDQTAALAQSQETATATPASQASTLESFLAAFAGELMTPMPVPANTPSTGVNTQDILNVGDEDEEKPSGAKKLKSMGAGHVEIEEEYVYIFDERCDRS